ncbi:MAG: glycosyltransferase family 2 protein, partial [Candidatus Eremiobacteraeota bacterium]|nr:glycosyltransferase family 2 protein [Candidatus Eremiobacteraeota bacterium]
MLLSVVVPMYNEEQNVAPLLARLVPLLQRVTGEDGYEIVLVNDGSSDGTLASMRAAIAAYADVVVIDLSRNFGHQLAATAGIELAQGEAVALMDGDLQDPPELIADFLARYREGYDVVYAVRRTRKGESFFK